MYKLSVPFMLEQINKYGAEPFIEELKKLTDLPIITWDERLSTVSAIKSLNETNTRGKKRKEVLDAVAAVVILENYMAWRKNNK